jgi:hypothetical protein
MSTNTQVPCLPHCYGEKPIYVLFIILFSIFIGIIIGINLGMLIESKGIVLDMGIDFSKKNDNVNN